MLSRRRKREGGREGERGMHLSLSTFSQGSRPRQRVRWSSVTPFGSFINLGLSKMTSTFVTLTTVFLFPCHFSMLRNKPAVCKFHVFHVGMVRVVQLRPDSRTQVHVAQGYLHIHTVREIARRSKCGWNTDSHICRTCKGVVWFL